MENAIEKLTKKIAWHESEAQRLRTALEVFREMERDGEAAATVTSFANMTFMQALHVVLQGGAKKKTGDIRRALEVGGFKSEAGNFRTMVQNRLADAWRRHKLVKNGRGKGLTWSLPPS